MLRKGIYLLPLLLATTTFGALSPISVEGTKLYDENGKQFFVKGVAYQPAGSTTVGDPLADTDQCQIDAGLMKDMGVNTVRVYTVDGTQNHDGCMQAFNSQGIYVWVDLPSPTVAINRADPEWTMDMYSNWTGTVDAFAKYDNLLSFTIGNEVINDEDTTIAAPYIKAATRDIKAFRDARGYRPIPISYGSADLLSLRLITAEYMACGNGSAKLDIFGLNVFSWCGNSSYYASGYDQLYTEFQDLDIPVLFTETGCNAVTPRDFAEVATMLGSVFPAIFSGAIVYEWLNEASEFGLVEYPNVNGSGFPSTLDDYNALKTVYEEASPVGTSRASYTPSNSPPACPTSQSEWSINGDVSLPTIVGLDLNTVTARTTYTTSGPTASNGTTSSGSAHATETRSSSAGIVETKNSGFSTGAIVGIAVGGAAIGIGAVIGAFFIYRRRKLAQQRQQEKSKNPNSNGSDDGDDEVSGMLKSELPAQSVGRVVVPKQELEAGHHEYYAPIANSRTAKGDVYELGSTARKRQSKPSEMEGCQPAVHGISSTTENI